MLSANLFWVNTSPAFKSYFQFPSVPTVVVTSLLFCNVILTVAPAIPVPEILRSVESSESAYAPFGVTTGAVGLATLSWETSILEPSEKVTLTTLFVSSVVPAVNLGFPFNVWLTCFSFSAKLPLIFFVKLPLVTSLLPYSTLSVGYTISFA